MTDDPENVVQAFGFARNEKLAELERDRDRERVKQELLANLDELRNRVEAGEIEVLMAFGVPYPGHDDLFLFSTETQNRFAQCVGVLEICKTMLVQSELPGRIDDED